VVVTPHLNQRPMTYEALRGDLSRNETGRAAATNSYSTLSSVARPGTGNLVPRQGLATYSAPGTSFRSGGGSTSCGLACSSGGSCGSRCLLHDRPGGMPFPIKR
jgi:hypothetical protein